MLSEIKNDRHHYFVDQQGRRQGEYMEWHDNGQLYMICNYINNVRNGLCRRYYDDGKLCYICFFKNGKNHSEYREWEIDGKIRLNFFCINNKDVYFQELPYPVTDEERMLFKLKYDLELITDKMVADAIAASSLKSC